MSLEDKIRRIIDNNTGVFSEEVYVDDLAKDLLVLFNDPVESKKTFLDAIGAERSDTIWFGDFADDYAEIRLSKKSFDLLNKQL
jgi:hypothetical protein